MIIRTLLGLAIATFASAAFAQGACSAESIQARQPELVTAIQTIAANDPDRMPTLTAELQQQMDAIQNGGDIATLCAFFDQVVAEAKG